MTELLNSYTFEAKKIVYYSVTVGANNKTEAKRIASNFEHCQHYEEVQYIEGDEYKVGKLLESTDEKACKSIKPTEDQMRQLTLTNEQFEVLFDILRDTVDVIEGDLITTEDENGNEILEDITEYEAYKIFQLIKNIRGKSND